MIKSVNMSKILRLVQYLIQTKLSVLPVSIIINLILSLQAGFLSFSRDEITNPNSQEKEHGSSCQPRVLEKEQAALARPGTLCGKDSSQKGENGWKKGNPQWGNHTNKGRREGRNCLLNRSLRKPSVHSVTIYTIYAKGQIRLLMCREENDPLGREMT